VTLHFTRSNKRQDDRGFFVELARLSKSLATQIVPEGDCLTERRYHPADEFRIAYNYPAIAYEGETQYN
jgi:dTDP-4-dehydrorhamnose 3,5-epimerase-like enzyme